MKYLVVIISLIVVGANQIHVGDPGPEYQCSHCQPEQIHISFGGKL